MGLKPGLNGACWEWHGIKKVKKEVEMKRGSGLIPWSIHILLLTLPLLVNGLECNMLSLDPVRMDVSSTERFICVDVALSSLFLTFNKGLWSKARDFQHKSIIRGTFFHFSVRYGLYLCVVSPSMSGSYNIRKIHLCPSHTKFVMRKSSRKYFQSVLNIPQNSDVNSVHILFFIFKRANVRNTPGVFLAPTSKCCGGKKSKAHATAFERTSSRPDFVFPVSFCM